MLNPKERHYWAQLRAALTGGQWKSSFPAKAYNSDPLPWSELFRKFSKHCLGSKGVIEVASQTHILGSFLATATDDEDVIGNAIRPPLDLGNECMLKEERFEEALTSYEILKALESSNSRNFSLAYYAYALHKPEECLEHLSKVTDILTIQDHIPDPTRTNTAAPSHRGDTSGSSFTASFVTLPDSSLPEVRDGRAWAMAETFRSICLQGMSQEKLHPLEPRRALEAYLSSFPLFTIITSEFTLCSPTQSTGKLDFTPFLQLREMWRWVERLLWRAIVLSSRLSEVHQDESNQSLWRWFYHYTACSVAWPAHFRTAHRSTVYSIYLRAFVLRYHNPPELTICVPKQPPWVSQARSLVQDYRGVLSVSTQFPRAGESNVKVEQFVDLCVAVWEASGSIGERAGWVIEILWWATRYTFNSPRIYRHMTRLFHLSGDTPLAIRTLKLYVQIVGKAYQASKQGVSEDVDGDILWVETLVFGIRMLCRSTAASDDPESIEEVRYAENLIEKSRSRLSKENDLLVASVFLAEGVCHSVMALKEEDSYTRPQRLRDAHNAFIQSIRAQPTASGYYHLALSFARPGPTRDIQKAVESAGLALEADPKEIRYWHLLGLLLTGQEKWKEAVEILERGADLDKEVSGESEDDKGGIGGDVGSEEEHDYVTVERERVPTSAGGTPPTPSHIPREVAPTPTHKPVFVLGADEVDIPPASRLLRSMLEKTPPSKMDVYEYSLQLRMTQAALTEVIDGPEGAEERWVEVFSWIAEKKGVMQPSDHSHRQSIESAIPPSMMDKTFVASHTHESIPTNMSMKDEPSQPHSQLVLAPIPITVSPATPTENVHDDVQSPEGIFSDKKNGENREKDKNWDKEKGKMNGLRVKRSLSIDRADTSKSKKMQQMLKQHVHKGRAGISAVSRKIGHGVSKHHHLHLRRTSSSPADFHEVIRSASYQASSIHSRRRLGSFLQLSDRTSTQSPPPPPPSLPSQPLPSQQDTKPNSRQAKENRLLSDLWLMSAATFRRLGKIEQAKGAIQEAEVKDEGNPNVWVQLGLYHFALGYRQHAIDALQKALFIDTDYISAAVHLSRIYLTTSPPASPQWDPSCTSHSFAHSDSDSRSLSPTPSSHPPLPQRDGDEADRSNVDLAAGLLSHLTKGKGWDVPEAWYFLAKAYGAQGRKEKERGALKVALGLSEGRGVREIHGVLGWCI